jgi:hypothetical protein
MNIQFFICFHKKLYDIYNITTDEKEKYLTFYGVKNKDTLQKNIVYEYELPHYNSVLQQHTYNEGSCIYHVYKNKLYTKYDYVGFCQYDMIFPETIFSHIESTISNNNNTIFYLDFFGWAFLGGQTTITHNYPNSMAGLQSYNLFFNKTYTTDDLIRNKMNVCNTFLIPKKMYEKMMSWLLQYFRDDIFINKCNNGHTFDPGHMIEALTSMFLALEINEGAVYEKLQLQHSSNLKI